MQTTSKVSVLIPTYRPNSAFLIEALQSLQQQTFTDWTALIHDDCSDVDTRKMIEPFLQDPKITFKKSERRLGIGGNWNACVEQTDAPHVAFLFQDDLWNPDYLKSAFDALQQHPSAGFVSLDHRYRGEHDMTNLPLYEAVRTFKKQNVRPGLHEGSALLKFWITHGLSPNIIGEPSFVVLRRSAMNQVGAFLTDMPQFLDSEYWMRILKITDWMNLSNREYGIFRVHAAAASAMNQEAGEGLFDRLRCFEKLIKMSQGEMRAIAISSRKKAIESMIVKFFHRVQSGKKASAKGSNTLVKFCLQHPVIISTGILKYFFTKKVKKSNL